MMSSDEEYLTPAELMKRWKDSVKPQTLANWRMQRKGPAFCRVGAKILYPLSAVIEWERKNLVTTPGEKSPGTTEPAPQGA